MTTGQPMAQTPLGVPQKTLQSKKEKHLVHWFRKGWKEALQFQPPFVTFTEFVFCYWSYGLKRLLFF